MKIIFIICSKILCDLYVDYLLFTTRDKKLGRARVCVEYTCSVLHIQNVTKPVQVPGTIKSNYKPKDQHISPPIFGYDAHLTS